MRDDDHPQPTDNRTGQPTTTDGVLRLTYSQIGKRLGMTADAARQLARRKGWSRTRPNRIGEPAVVSVPVSELSSEQPPADRRATDDEPPVNRPGEPSVAGSEPPADNRRSDLSMAVETLRSAVEMLGQQLQAERHRVAAAEARAEAAKDAAESLRTTHAAELAAAQEAARRRSRMPRRSGRQRTARKARGRLRRAWDGWRGR